MFTKQNGHCNCVHYYALILYDFACFATSLSNIVLRLCQHSSALAGTYSAVPPPASIQKAPATPAATKTKKSDTSDSSDDSSDEEEKKVARKRSPSV